MSHLSLETRNTLLARCLSADAPIYRDLFGSPTLRVENEHEWEALPFLTKDLLRATPIEDRLFIPVSGVAGFFHSSGTSGKSLVFMPRSIHPRYSGWKKEYLHGIKSILACQFPLPPSAREITMRAYGWHGRVILFDPYHAHACVGVAKAAGINAIMLPPQMCMDASKHLISEGMCDQIRLIELSGGEPCTQALFAFLRSTFKNAIITYYYNCSEIELAPLGIPCEPMREGEILELFHAQEGHHIELRDTRSGKMLSLEQDNEGELVVSSFCEEPAAFPLIRYQTGDVIRMHGACKRHDAPLFSMSGRAELDFVKVATGQIRADALSHALSSLTPPLSDDFELHYYAVDTPGRTQSILKIYGASREEQGLAERLMRMIPVSADRCYYDFVTEGYLLPLTIEFSTDKHSAKARRIIRHDI